MPVAAILGALVFGGVGLAICWGALRSLLERKRTLARSLRAEGTVVEMRTDSSGWDNVFKYPVVRFTTASGTVVQFEASVREEPPRHQVGDRVPVFYDPASPGRADIAGTEETALWLLVIFIGLPFLLIGAGLVVCVLLGGCAAE